MAEHNRRSRIGRVAIPRLIFVAGVVLGMVGMCLLEMRTRVAYRNTIMSVFLADERMSADRALCQGDLFGSAHHRWDVVTAEARDGVWAPQVWRFSDADLFEPFALLDVDRLASSLSEDPLERGERIEQGRSRAYLAATLELAGASSDAEQQWHLAEELT